MSKENIIVGIDIGSSNIKTVIAQSYSDVEIPRIIGVGVVPSTGVRRGIISDIEETAKNINESVEKAELEIEIWRNLIRYEKGSKR